MVKKDANAKNASTPNRHSTAKDTAKDTTKKVTKKALRSGETSKSDIRYDKCPCGTSDKSSWMIKCTSCPQTWHSNCSNLKGIPEEFVTQLEDWLCPLCFNAPGVTIRNNQQIETLLLNMSHPRNKNTDLEETIRKMEEKLTSLISYTSDLGATTNSVSERVLKLDDIELHIQHRTLQEGQVDEKLKTMKNQITELQTSVNDLKIPTASSSSPQTTQTPSTSSSQSWLHPSRITPPTHPTAPIVFPEPTSTINHNQESFTDLKPDFIDEDTATNIITSLQSSSFVSESGRSTIAFGAPYTYTGSKSGADATPIPLVLQPILDKINVLQNELFYEQHPSYKSDPSRHPSPPVINSCLVNKYEGPNSSLPSHSDDEPTIDVESSIFTLSLGQECSIQFLDKKSGVKSELISTHRSLYHMTRKSQDFFTHSIPEGNIPQDTRYSLTFRSVNWKNKNSTILIGDSNTGMLKFGTNKRNTFGELMPGLKVWAPTINTIDPNCCTAYSNVVIMCGINDVKLHESDVRIVCKSLLMKIKEIKLLNPKCFVYVCPLLPTKIAGLLTKVNCFNELLMNGIASMSSGVRCVQGFNGFADHHGMLVHQLSKTVDRHNRPDTLHLNELGARVLAGLIKQTIFSRLHRGVDKRKGPTSRVNGRPFSSVANGGGGFSHQVQ